MALKTYTFVLRNPQNKTETHSKKILNQISQALLIHKNDAGFQNGNTSYLSLFQISILMHWVYVKLLESVKNTEWVSDRLLFNVVCTFYSAISRRDKLHIDAMIRMFGLLDQCAHYSTRSLKQQSEGRHNAPHGHTNIAFFVLWTFLLKRRYLIPLVRIVVILLTFFLYSET